MNEQSSQKRVGFFTELSHGDSDGPSLVQSRRPAAGDHEAAIAAYLATGKPSAVSPGPVWDVIDGSGPIGTASVYTDGEWIWPGDLRHYLQKYHVVLPSTFVEHVLSKQERA
jgi:hypothetical protein